MPPRASRKGKGKAKEGVNDEPKELGDKFEKMYESSNLILELRHVARLALGLVSYLTFKTAPPKRNPDIQLASYLQDPDTKSSYYIELSATLETPVSTNNICMTQFSSLYWTLRDLVAHKTANGCKVSTGDLLATGTVSESSQASHAYLMELAVSGGVDIKNASGQSEKKMWLAVSDAVRLTGLAAPGVGFGDCFGEILPADI